MMIFSFFSAPSLQKEKKQTDDKKPKEVSQRDLKEPTEANHRG